MKSVLDHPEFEETYNNYAEKFNHLSDLFIEKGMDPELLIEVMASQKELSKIYHEVEKHRLIENSHSAGNTMTA